MCFKNSPHSTLFTAGNVHLIRKKYVIKQISKQTFYHVFIEIEKNCTWLARAPGAGKSANCFSNL